MSLSDIEPRSSTVYRLASIQHARVAKSADAADLKSAIRKDVQVQILSRARCGTNRRPQLGEIEAVPIVSQLGPEYPATCRSWAIR